MAVWSVDTKTASTSFSTDSKDSAHTWSPDSKNTSTSWVLTRLGLLTSAGKYFYTSASELFKVKYEGE